MDKKNLFKKFTLGEGNPEHDAIMYTIRYTPGRIRAHRQQVASALGEIGVVFEDGTGSVTAVPTKDLNESERYRVHYLLEELSVMNEAMDYVESGLRRFRNRNIHGVMDTIIHRNYHHLAGKGSFEEAYGLVADKITHITSGMKAADERNSFLYSHERAYLDELENLSKKPFDIL